MILLYHLFLILFACDVHSIVITKFNHDRISTYYLLLEKYTHGQVGNESLYWNKQEYCHILRQSRIFEMNQDVNASPELENPIRVQFITQQTLETERNQSDIQRNQVQMAKSKSIRTVPSLKCWNLMSEQQWLVSPAFIPDSAFLFSIDPDPDFIFFRAITGSRKLIPKLTALIDDPAAISTDSMCKGKEFLIQKYVKSVISTNFSDRDILCDLNRMMKYRLCSIIANNIRIIPCELMGQNVTFQIYKNRKTSVYYEPVDPEYNCQLFTVDVGTANLNDLTEITRKLLLCSLKITTPEDTTERLTFYSSLNLLQNTRVFVFQRSNNEEDLQTINVDELIVPLLKHLPSYKKIFENVDI